MMKKPAKKLTIRRETIQALHGAELERARGGVAAIVMDSGYTNCSQVAIAKSAFGC